MELKLSPSLLAADVSNLRGEIEKVDAYTDMLHIDVMDGHFVPNISYGVPVVKGLRKVTDTMFDVHLMIDNPSKYIKPFAEAGSDMITIHVEAPDDIAGCLKQIQAMGKKCGLALNPDTPPEAIAPYIEEVDMVLQMTVFPGFGGQGMVESAIQNLPVLRNMLGDKDLEVDGGIYIENCRKVVEAGANVLVSGTGIFGQKDPVAAIRAMRKEAAEF